MDENTIKAGIHVADESSFKYLYLKKYDGLFRFSMAILNEYESVQEVISDVFIQLWNRRAEILKIEDLDAYLYKSVKNRSLNVLKKRKKYDNTAYEFISKKIKSADNSEDKILFAELQKAIQNAINRLPPKCKLCYLLVKEEGKSYKEVGEILDISPRTVNGQLVIALKLISKYLKNIF